MKRKTPLKAIKAYCYDCSNGSRNEIKNCLITDCPLYEFRMGKNPNRKGIAPRNAIGFSKK